MPNYDLILVDDDVAITAAWEIYSQAKGKNIAIYHSIPQFNQDKPLFELNTPIYLDHDLNEELTGLVFAHQLTKEGFGNVYLTTGHAAEQFAHYTWLKGVVNKKPPF